MTPQPMSSPGKIRLALTHLAQTVPETAADAAIVLFASQATPYLDGMLPEDPRVLDDLLVKGARMLLGLRSDTAPAADVLVEGEDPDPTDDVVLELDAGDLEDLADAA